MTGTHNHQNSNTVLFKSTDNCCSPTYFARMWARVSVSLEVEVLQSTFYIDHLHILDMDFLYFQIPSSFRWIPPHNSSSEAMDRPLCYQWCNSFLLLVASTIYLLIWLISFWKIWHQVFLFLALVLGIMWHQVNERRKFMESSQCVSSLTSLFARKQAGVLEQQSLLSMPCDRKIGSMSTWSDQGVSNYP